MNSQRKLLAASALIEFGTGLVLIVVPAFAANLLLGPAVLPQGIEPARIAGVALLALGLACWQSPRDPANRPEVFRAMLLYNTLVALYFALLGGVRHVEAPLLWPAVALHACTGVALLVTSARGRAAVKTTR